MKTKQLLIKTLLVAVGLLTGASAWADTMTTMTGLLGPADNGNNDFGTYASKSVTIAAGETLVYTLVNYNKGAEGTDLYENWTVEGRRSDNTHCFDFRADGGYWTWKPDADAAVLSASYSGSTSTDISATASEWLAAYNGVTVTLTITRSNDGDVITVTHAATTNTSVSYSGTFTCSGFGTGAATIILLNQKSHQAIQKVVHSNEDGGIIYTARMTYISGTTANQSTSYGEVYTATTGYNKISGGSVDLANSGWGVNNIIYVQMDATDVPTSDATITSATLGMNVTCDGSRGHTIGVGYNSATWSNSMTWNSADRSITTLDDTKSAVKSATTALSFDVVAGMTAGSAKSLLIYDLAAGGCTLSNVTATITYTTEATYTATFTETNSLSPTVTIYSDEGMTDVVANGTLLNSTTYYYKATLTGYNDATGSFTVSSANPSISFTMTAKSSFTYTKRAVCGSDVLNATLATGSDYEGETITLSWPKYIKVGEQWYVATASTFQSSATASATEDVEYTPSDIAYFYEMESGLTRSGGAALSDNMNIGSTLSSGLALRLSRKSLYYTPALAGGVYTLSIPWRNTNSSENEVHVYTRSSEGELSSELTTFTGTASSNGTFNYVITVPDGYSIAFDGNEANNANNNVRMDYMTLTPYTVSKTITSAGWATYCSPYALDFSSSIANLEAAYIVTGGDGSVLSKTKVTGTVPANIGLLLKGEGECVIPVVASGDAANVSGNKLVGVTAETPGVAAGIYVLLNETTGAARGLGFYKTTNAFTVGANTAYLPADFDGASARAFYLFDDGNTTAIEGVKTQQTIDGVYYNIAGQRVSQPTKGLYIMNGRKVVVK